MMPPAGEVRLCFRLRCFHGISPQALEPVHQQHIKFSFVTKIKGQAKQGPIRQSDAAPALVIL